MRFTGPSTGLRAHRACRTDGSSVTCIAKRLTHLPPIGVSYGRAGMIGLWRRVPADSRHFMSPAGVAVRLRRGGPQESAAGGLQADSGHGTGAYTASDEACPRRDPALPAHKSLRT